MWERVKFIMGEMGSFLWPLIKQFLVAAAPVVKTAAIAAVQITATRYAGTVATNAEKHDNAFGLIAGSLAKQGIQIGPSVTESMIDTAIAAAVKGLK